MENRPPKSKSKIRQSTRPLIFCLIACGTIYYLFYPSGPIKSYLELDLGFLILPLLGYYVLRLFSRLSAIFIPSCVGLAATHILNALAFSFFSYFFFSRAVLLTRVDLGFLILPFLGYYILRLFSRLSAMLFPSRIGLGAAHILSGLAFSFFSYFFFSRIALLAGILALESSRWLLNDLGKSTPYVVLIFAGDTIVRLSNVLAQVPRGRLASPVIAAGGQALIGYALWQTSSTFSDFAALMNGVGIILLVAMLTVAISNLGVYGEKAHSALVADFSASLRRSPDHKFVWGGLIGGYLVFGRPALMSVTPYYQTIEWAIMCAVAWHIFNRIRDNLNTRYSVPPQEADWQKHLQQVDDLPDQDFDELVSLQQEFIEKSSNRLLPYLKQLLNSNGFNEKETHLMLRPLEDHHDRRARWYVFGWWRRRLVKRNRQNRAQVLKDTIENLGSIVRPAHQKT